MNKRKISLIKKAREMYKVISPCGSKSSLWDCFTIQGEMVYLWFNTQDNSTHMVVDRVGEGDQ